MRSVTVRNTGGAKRQVKEGAKGTTVELDAGGSHGCKVPVDGLAISGSGVVELQAGDAAPLIVQILGEEGDVLNEIPIAAGATVTCTGSHELLVTLDPAFEAAEEEKAAKAKADAEAEKEAAKAIAAAKK